MANTATSPDNKSVTFGKKMEREMAWNNDGIVNDGAGAKNPAGVQNKAPIKPQDMADGAKNPAGVTNAAPMKKPKRGMRKAAKGAMKRGMISEKAAKKHLGGY
jgi:hypothetical protein